MTNCVHLSCRDAATFNEALNQLGSISFRVLRISPAHAPAIAELTLADRSLAVRLRIDGRSDATVLLLKGLSDPRTLANGTRLEPFSTAQPSAASLPQRHVAKFEPSVTFDEGRAGMLYRNLLSENSDAVIASHIRVPDGPVPDYVHFHLVAAQIIFVVSGAVTLLYEGQGEAFVATAGNCVLQPPGIRHRVLSTTGNVSVLEVSSPAVHDTFGDLDMELPNAARYDAAHEWGGQTFVHFDAATSPEPWAAGWLGAATLEARGTGIGRATRGVMDVQTVRAAATTEVAVTVAASKLFLLFVLAGELTVDGGGEVLRHAESISLPHGTRATLRCAADTRFVCVTM